MYKKLLFVASLLAFTMSVKAGDTLRYTLEQCHEFALQNSATARLQSEEVQAAKYGRQAALAAMFPRVSANGGYMWNSRNAHLVGDEHSERSQPYEQDTYYLAVPKVIFRFHRDACK